MLTVWITPLWLGMFWWGSNVYSVDYSAVIRYVLVGQQWQTLWITPLWLGMFWWGSNVYTVDYSAVIRYVLVGQQWQTLWITLLWLGLFWWGSNDRHCGLLCCDYVCFGGAAMTDTVDYSAVIRFVLVGQQWQTLWITPLWLGLFWWGSNDRHCGLLCCD